LVTVIAVAAYVALRYRGQFAGLIRTGGAGQSVDHICKGLNRVASDISLDLAQLQITDTNSQLAEGWNRLLEEVDRTRQEMQNLELDAQVTRTLESHQSKWANGLIDSLPIGLVTVNDEWTIVYANKKAEQILTIDDEPVQNSRLDELVACDFVGAHPGQGITFDRTVMLPGSRTSIRIRSLQTGDDIRTPDHVLLVQDVTQQKEIEQERSQFLYHITHELRTPLTNIRAYAETLSEGVLKDEDMLRECYNVIVGETQRLSRLVEDILSLSQLEAGSARMQLDDVQTARLVRQVVEDMQAQADEKGVELVLSLPAKVPTLRGDKERLSVVLTNLIGNAVKYTPSRGHVEVSCVEDGTRLRISVSDSGIGISPEEQERVFEKFFRSQREEVTELPGTGLGLALAMETARAHGGTIELESEVGKGSTFTLVLPVSSLATVQS
jgi:signal transduction histidine kinase